MEKDMKVMRKRVSGMLPPRWKEFVTFELLLNSKGATKPESSDLIFLYQRPAEALDDELSVIFCEEIHHTASSEAGLLKIFDLECILSKHVIRVRTQYDFEWTYNGDALSAVLKLCDRFLEEVAMLVNDKLKKYEIYLPEGTADFRGCCVVTKEGDVTEDDIEYEGRFWIPLDDHSEKKRARWYLLQVEEVSYPEKAVEKINEILKTCLHNKEK